MTNLKSMKWLVLLSFVLAACARHPENFYFGNYSEAESLFARGQYEKAIQKYQAYIDENPEGNLAIIATYYIAKSHTALGHKDEARKGFEKIVKEHPDLVWANFSETQLKELASKDPVAVVEAPVTPVVSSAPTPAAETPQK